MPLDSFGNYGGLLSLCSFALSVIAAVIAIDMFRLLRTGQTGRSWRVLIIASVIYALMQALRMGEFLDWKALSKYALSQIVELIFALALAYSFYLQRKAFTVAPHRRRKDDDIPEPSTYSHDETEGSEAGKAYDTDWSRLGDTQSAGEAEVIRPLAPEPAVRATEPAESEPR